MLTALYLAAREELKRGAFRDIDGLWDAWRFAQIWNVPDLIQSSCLDCGAPYALHGLFVYEGSVRRRRFNTCGAPNPHPEVFRFPMRGIYPILGMPDMWVIR